MLGSVECDEDEFFAPEVKSEVLVNLSRFVFRPRARFPCCCLAGIDSASGYRTASDRKRAVMMAFE